jgi:hypothetical protein
MASVPSISTTSSSREADLPCLEYLLHRFDRAGLRRPAITWDPDTDLLPNPAFRAMQARWLAGERLRPTDAPVPPGGDLIFADSTFRLVGYPRRDGYQIVAVGDGAEGSDIVDVADLPIEVDVLRAVYAIAAAYGRSALVSLERPTMLDGTIVDRVIFPMGRSLLIAMAPRVQPVALSRPTA